MARIFNIELKFKTTGAKELRQAIQALAKAQAELAQKQAKLNAQNKIAQTVNQKLIQSEQKHRLSLTKTRVQIVQMQQRITQLNLKNKLLKERVDKTSGAFARLRIATSGLQRKLGAIRNTMLLFTFAFGSAIAAIRNFVQTSMQFEAVKVRLNAMYGSVERGTEAFQTFNKIAATTPFTLQDVVEAGATLKAFGADSEAMIKPVSDLAAFMGTTATEAAAALGRAFAGGAGAADILRERGILQLVKDFKGIDDLTKLTLPEFRRALEETLLDPASGIAGATDALSKTMSGMMSNLSDAFTRMAAALGDLINFREQITSLTNLFSSFAAFLNKINKETTTEISELRKELGLITPTVDKTGIALLDMLEAEKAIGKDRTFLMATTELKKAQEELLKVLLEKRAIEIENEKTSANVHRSTSEQSLAANRLRGTISKLNQEVAQFNKLIESQEKLISNVLDVPGADYADLVTKQFDNIVGFNQDPIQVRGLFPSNEDLAKGLQAFSDDLATQLEGFDREKFSRAFESLLEFEQLFQNQLVNGFMNSFNQILSMQQQNLDARIRNEINALKKTDKFRNVFMEQRQTMEDDIRAKFADQQKRIFQAQQAMQITKVIIDTAAAINQLMQTALAASIIDPSATARAKAISIAMGAVSAAQIGLIASQKPPAFARGGSFVTNGQQMIMVGDNAGGRERVDITPISSPDFGDAGGGNGITVNIMGNVIGTQEFVRDNLLPEIENSIRRNLA